jgi:phosphomannomutase
LEEAHSASLADAKARGIVLGFDHRALGALNSRRFAVLTAIAASANGWRVFLMSRFTLTPLVPFTIVKLGAAAGAWARWPQRCYGVLG